MPGNVGGMAWGGIAHDRVNDLLIMPVNNLAAEVRLVARDRVEAERQAGRLSGEFEYHPQPATRYGMVRRFLLAPGTHLPCTPPPWGTLAAIKPSTGEIAWQVPLGQFPGTRTIPGLEKTGSIALGGPIATAGGVIFTAGTLEPAIYAYDARTGARAVDRDAPDERAVHADDLSRPRRPAVRRGRRGRPRHADRAADRRLAGRVRAAEAAALTLYRGSSSITMAVCTVFWIDTELTVRRGHRHRHRHVHRPPSCAGCVPW